MTALRAAVGDYIPLVTPINSYCHSTENREAVTPVCRAHVECPPSIRRQKRSALPSASPSAAHHLSQIAGQNRPAIRRLGSSYMLPVSAFVVAYVPGTTRKHANETTTALQPLRRASARCYLRHSPPLRPLNHRADHRTKLVQARHREPTRQPQWLLR